jgi:hypothetical protein
MQINIKNIKNKIKISVAKPEPHHFWSQSHNAMGRNKSPPKKMFNISPIFSSRFECYLSFITNLFASHYSFLTVESHILVIQFQ